MRVRVLFIVGTVENSVHKYVGDYDAQHEKHNVSKKVHQGVDHQVGDSSDGQSTVSGILCPIQTSYDLFSFLSF